MFFKNQHISRETQETPFSEAEKDLSPNTLTSLSKVWPSATEFLKALLEKTKDNPELRQEWIKNWRTLPIYEWPRELQELLFEVKIDYYQSPSCKQSRREALKKIGTSAASFGIGTTIFSGNTAELFSQIYTMMQAEESLLLITNSIQNVKDPKLKQKIKDISTAELEKFFSLVNQRPTDALYLSGLQDLLGLGLVAHSGKLLFEGKNLDGHKFNLKEIGDMFLTVEAYLKVESLLKKMPPTSPNLPQEKTLKFCKIIALDKYLNPKLSASYFISKLFDKGIPLVDRQEVASLLGIKIELENFTFQSHYYCYFKILSKYRGFHAVEKLLADLKPKLSPGNYFNDNQTENAFSQEDKIDISLKIDNLFNAKLNLKFDKDSQHEDSLKLDKYIEIYYHGSFDKFLSALQREQYMLNYISLKRPANSILEHSEAAEELKILALENPKLALLLALLLEQVPNPDERFEFLDRIKSGVRKSYKDKQILSKVAFHFNHKIEEDLRNYSGAIAEISEYMNMGNNRT